MGRCPIRPPILRPSPTRAAFLNGFVAAWRSVFAYVLIGNYIGIGALAYEFGFSLAWMVLSTLLIWAAPAQVILISTLTTATLLEVAIAVGLSSARFLPMVAALVPVLKRARTRQLELLLPTHLTAISVWVEGMRLLPQTAARASASRSTTAWASGLLSAAVLGSVIGHVLAARLPPLLATTLLFFTPMAILMSSARNNDDADRPAGVRARPGDRPAAGGAEGQARPDVDRRDRGLDRLCGAPAARGDAMTLAEIGPYLALILVGFLPNEVWRVLGLVVVRGLSEDSQIIVWVRAVATAILAGVHGAAHHDDDRRARRHPAVRADRRGGAGLCRVPGGAPLGVRRRAGRRTGVSRRRLVVRALEPQASSAPPPA